MSAYAPPNQYLERWLITYYNDSSDPDRVGTGLSPSHSSIALSTRTYSTGGCNLQRELTYICS
jgi:hypothetical protein